MNVITVLLDSVRRDFLSAYGNTSVHTPRISEFASQSVVFDNAYIGSYPCMPARRELWTGKYEFPWRGWGPLEWDEPTLPSKLQEQSIVSMLITDHYHLWERGGGNYHHNFSGFEFIRGQENDKWVTGGGPVQSPAPQMKMAEHTPEGALEQYLRNTNHAREEADYFGPQVMTKAMHWLEKHDPNQPFFLMIDSFDPHEPFDPPDRYLSMYGQSRHDRRLIWPTYGPCHLQDNELEQVRALYAGELSMMDAWFGKLLDKIKTLGYMDNTMIILATDHGHMFGEHEVIGKPWGDIGDANLYQELAHIPLIIYHPNQSSGGRRSSQLVQMVDLHATILDSLGIRDATNVHGYPLNPLLVGDKDEDCCPIRKVACYGRFSESINVTDGEWTLFLWPKHSKVEHGRNALYHIKEDPKQLYNLYSQHPNTVAALKQDVKIFLSSIGAPSGLEEDYDL